VDDGKRVREMVMACNRVDGILFKVCGSKAFDIAKPNWAREANMRMEATNAK
jgi:hypothetical protein